MQNFMHKRPIEDPMPERVAKRRKNNKTILRIILLIYNVRFDDFTNLKRQQEIILNFFYVWQFFLINDR